MTHPVVGDIDRYLNGDETDVAGKTVAAFIRACRGSPPEVAVYALAIIIEAMAKPYGATAQGGEAAAVAALLEEIRSIAGG